MKKPIILVLGMHRSGTSLVSQLIAKWGAYLGEEDEINSKGRDNKDGFWEFAPLVHLNDLILKKLNSSWRNPPQAILESELDSLILEFNDQAQDLVDKMDESHRVWSWKDPRLCNLLDFWKKFFIGRKVYAIVTIRNPEDTADSLYKRNGIVHSASVLLWEKAIRDIFKHQDFFTKIHLVNYDNLLNSNLEELSNFYHFLNDEFSKDEDELVLRQMMSILKIELKHNANNTNLKHFSINQREIYQSLLDKKIEKLNTILKGEPLFVGTKDFLDSLESSILLNKQIIEQKNHFEEKIRDCDLIKKNLDIELLKTQQKASDLNSRLVSHEEWLKNKDDKLIEKDRIISSLIEQLKKINEDKTNIRQLIFKIEERELLLINQLDDLKKHNQLLISDNVFIKKENEKEVEENLDLKSRLDAVEKEVDYYHLMFKSKSLRFVLKFKNYARRFLGLFLNHA